MVRMLRTLTALIVVALSLFQDVPSPSPQTVQAFDITKLPPVARAHVSGFASFELDPANAEITDKNDQPSNYVPRGSDSCPVNLSSNIKVNQNCLNISDPDLQGRGQSQNETSIAQDPNNPNHMIGTFNDYRRGDGNCYGAYSTDKGRTWNDSTIPMSFTRGKPFGPFAREYWQAGGDTSVGWDTKGNAYFSCQVFNRGQPTSPNQDQSSALLVFRSTLNNGASWNFPGRYVTDFNDVAGAGNALEDKQLLTVDNTVGSPYQDRVYVTWTEFAPDGSAYIYESHSADYGETFSPRHLVSADSALCPVTYGVPTPNGKCNENQFSQPFTGPDGALYVAFANFNNAEAKASDNRYQMLIAKSTDGGVTFTPPQKVADYYDLPDCPTYQGGANPYRSCVPEKGPTTNSIFRATNYPSGAVNPTNPRQVVVSFGSYINVHSNEANGCAPSGFSPFGNPLYTGVKAAGACNNDILLSVSNDGGATFTGTAADPRALTTVTQDAGQATTDQWFQWLAFTKTGKLAVSYYDRQYGTDETTGFSDFSLSGSGDLTNFAVQRVTSDSMPVPTQFGGLFWGDYTGLTAVDNAYPIWSDTRSPELFLCPGTGVAGKPPAVCGQNSAFGVPANDQDVYTAALPVPSK